MPNHLHPDQRATLRGPLTRRALRGIPGRCAQRLRPARGARPIGAPFPRRVAVRRWLATAALDAIPPRLDTPLVFSSPSGKLLNIDNFRRRVWAPAIEASGVRTRARLYDLRSTFASDALAAGVTVFELARIKGTSVPMIERHYGTLLDGAGAGIVVRLDALDAERDQNGRHVEDH
jgi:integrase